jgi:membrane-associated phospholipid phosphatase
MDLNYDRDFIRASFYSLKPFLKLLSFFGLGGTQSLLLVIILMAFRSMSSNMELRWRIKRYVFSAVAAIICSGILVQILKHMIGRPRPRFGDLWGIAGPTFISGFDSFPSGHSATSFAVAAVTACCFPKIRWHIFVVASGIAASRVLLGSHYPSDVAAGMVLGIVTGNLVVKWLERYGQKDFYRLEKLELKTGGKPLDYYAYCSDRNSQHILKDLIDIYNKIPEHWRSKSTDHSDLLFKCLYPDHEFYQTRWSTVIKMPQADSSLYFKAFHYYGIEQMQSIILYPSKSYIFFNSAEHLSKIGINVPHVMAFGEARKGILLKKCFLLYKEIHGTPIHKLSHLSRDLIKTVAYMVRNIHEQGIYHGDLRPQNILWDNGKVGFIDLERLKIGNKNNISLIVRDLGKLHDPRLPISRFGRLRFFITYLAGNNDLWQKRKNILGQVIKYSSKAYK